MDYDHTPQHTPATNSPDANDERQHNMGLSRRAFLRGLAAFGGTALLAACGGAPEALSQGSVATSAPEQGATNDAPAATAGSADAATSAPAASAGEPRQGGVYRALTSEQFGSLDPALAFNYFDWWISYMLLYNRLYGFDEAGNTIPELAEGLPQVSDDGLTYTVKLKKGVTFHNGREINAEDVKFSFERIVWPETESGGAGYITNIAGYDDVAAKKTKELEGIKVIDEHTVAFTLQQPQAVFPGIMGVATFAVVPKQEVIEAGKDRGTKVLIGTGPFKLTEWVQSESVAFERNPDYFKSGKPYLDRVEVKLNVKDEVGVLQWESGDAEFVYSAPSADLARIRADPNLSKLIRETPSLAFYYLTFAGNVKPFDDVRVRQAVAMSLDKQTLADRSQQGVVLDGIYPAGIAQHDPDFKSDYAYDPEKAKQLLQEAGVSEGFNTIFWSGGTNKELGEIIQADLKTAGLDPELLVLHGSSFDIFKDRINSGEIPLTSWGFGSDYPDGSSFLSARVLCSQNPPPPPSQFCDAKIAELAAEADRLPLDDPKRVAALRQIQQIIVNEQVYMVPLYARTALVLSQAYVHGDTPDPLLTLPVAENVWMEEKS